MDEPTAALAVAEVDAVLELIRRSARKGVSVILITHRLQDLFVVCDRIMVLYEGRSVAERRIGETEYRGDRQPDRRPKIPLGVGWRRGPESEARVLTRGRSSPMRCAIARALIIHDNGGVVSIALFFVVMAVTFSLITDTFLTQPNLLNILRQIAPLMIVAVAMTFVITTGGIDLSVGSVLALVNALAAISLQAGLPWPLVIVLMLGVGDVIGLVQGFFIAYEGIPAFIVTLAGLSSIRGMALLLTKGYSIPIDPESPFNEIGRGWVFGIPMPALIAVVVLAVGLPRLQRNDVRSLCDRHRRQRRSGAARGRQHARGSRLPSTC